jgi:hypothetical protein
MNDFIKMHFEYHKYANKTKSFEFFIKCSLLHNINSRFQIVKLCKLILFSYYDINLNINLIYNQK